MIQANELRIGNWLRSSENFSWDTRKIGKVESIHSDGINHWQDMGASGKMQWKDLYGIEITSSILISAGFKKHVPYDLILYLPSDRGYLQSNGTEVWIELEINDLTYDIDPPYKCRYVHQLQNLYYALTGKELEFAL